MKALKLAHVNIRGLKSKLEDIKNDNDLLNGDILCFSKTRLDKTNSIDDNVWLVDQRKLHRCDRNSNGGGVLVALNDKYPSKDLLLVHPNLEIVST